MKKYKCPSCNGDGISTCHNPDHGFLSAMDGIFLNANESACPCCGHSSDHKMTKWVNGKRENRPCEYCNATGQCNEQEAELAINECNIDNPIEDYEL